MTATQVIAFAAGIVVAIRPRFGDHLVAARLAVDRRRPVILGDDDDIALR